MQIVEFEQEYKIVLSYFVEFIKFLVKKKQIKNREKPL